MKYLKSYQDHNEGLKSTLLGAGLAAGLLLGDPNKSMANDTTSITQTTPNNQLKTEIETLSKLRKEKCNDKELCNILDEIKSKVNSNDSSKLIELFNKLNVYAEKKYDYKIDSKKVEELTKTEIDQMKEKMNLFAILGWLGSICLAICGVPQAWMSYREKHSEGISWGFLLLWAFGELFALAYVYDKLDLPLLVNYAVNILIVGVILYYKIYPQVDQESD